MKVHLKLKVRNKIWKGEYVEFFTQPVLEKLNPGRFKWKESKKEGKERLQ